MKTTPITPGQEIINHGGATFHLLKQGDLSAPGDIIIPKDSTCFTIGQGDFATAVVTIRTHLLNYYRCVHVAKEEKKPEVKLNGPNLSARLL